MSDDWKRLQDAAYVGGAVRERDERGRTMHRRIARIDLDEFSISFRFDRVAVLERGGWKELPLTDNDFMWFPFPLMAIAFDTDGTARPGSPELPSFIEAVHPRTALPADSPAFARAAN